jgi:hypothetical protein
MFARDPCVFILIGMKNDITFNDGYADGPMPKPPQSAQQSCNEQVPSDMIHDFAKRYYTILPSCIHNDWIGD